MPGRPVMDWLPDLWVIRISGDGQRAPIGPCQGRRSRRNFSRKRPETTNLNHQYAIRRVFMCHVLDTEMAQPHPP